MSIISIRGAVIALSTLLLGLASTAAMASPLVGSDAAASAKARPGNVQDVRHRGWGGIGVYIGPRYGYGYRYGPRYRHRYYGDRYYSYGNYYDRPYRHSRRWARERFKHPLGRR